MRKDRIQNYFTYGFELEGNFFVKLDRILKKELRKYSGVSKSYTHDGSVNQLYEAYMTARNKIHFDKETHKRLVEYREVRVGIFKRLDDMLDILSLFNYQNGYLRDRSAGLHIHIKPKAKYHNELKWLIGDYDFLRKLKKFASGNLSKETKERIERNEYCKAHLGFKTAYRFWCGRAKYNYIRNHPSGTIEFRFFDSDKQKVKNVKKFFRYFFSELKKVKPMIEKKYKLEKERETKVLIPLAIMNENTNLVIGSNRGNYTKAWQRRPSWLVDENNDYESADDFDDENNFIV